MIKAGEQKEKEIVKEWVNVAQLENYSMLFVKMTLGDVAARALLNNWPNLKTSSDYRWVYFADKYFATKCTDYHFSPKLNGLESFHILSSRGAFLLWDWNFKEACQTSHALHASLGNQNWYKKIERHFQKKRKKKRKERKQLNAHDARVQKWYTDVHCSSNVSFWQGWDVAELYFQKLLSFRIKTEKKNCYKAKNKK